MLSDFPKVSEEGSDCVMERRIGTVIKKWDDVNGSEEELPREMDPNMIGNVRRGLEDQIEQNDNNLDGIINNVKREEELVERIRDDNCNGIPDENEDSAVSDNAFESASEKEARCSLLFKLHECKPSSDDRSYRVISPELVL